jgi:hypothetical protein
MLARFMTAEHVAAQQARIGDTIRVRPSDIASAAHLIQEDSEAPLKFDDVAPLAAIIEQELLLNAMQPSPS